MFKHAWLAVLAAVTLPAQPAKVPSLPAPYATPDAANPGKLIPKPESAKLAVPAGFAVEEYAAALQKPRFMLQGPSGEVLVTESTAKGDIVVLTDGGKSRKKLIEGLDRPYGLAWHKEFLYVAEPTSIKRYKYDAKTMTAGLGEEIIPFKGYDKGHWTHGLQFDAKGEYLYISVGSSGDHVIGDPEDRAAVLRFRPDGTGKEIIATGLRNPVGLKFAPNSSELWTSVQERDHFGEDLVPDFFTSIRKGGFYGWPYAYVGPHEDPRAKGLRKDLVDSTIVPDVILPPHCAVLDFTFYNGKAFPAEYRGGAFLAFHGSSNRAKRLGYSVAFVPFKNGKPAGQAKDFLSGFMLGEDQKEIWGRPVAVLEMKDGSLLVSDDGANKLWRVSYKSH